MRSKLAIVLTLLAATLLVYWQCGSHEFIILDDHSYVTLNPEIQGGLNWPGIRWAFSAASMEATGNWHPVTWLSHMADIQLFALNPAGHHLTNVCLHAANAALLFLALSAMSGALWCSAAVAAIFALHPLHVESVAWVSERKDVLSTFFWMLTMLCYASYARRPRPAPYLAALAAFCLGLMAKPMLVTLPLVLLCLDVWPLRRSAAALSAGAAPAPDPAASPAFPRRGFGALLLEKLPFLGITALFCAIALYSQGKGHMANLAEYPLAFRLYNGLLGYRGYLSKAFWPTDLAVFYPFPVLGSLRPALGCILLLLGISVPVLFNRRRRPYLLVGWL